MEEQNTCQVVKDLLPNYIENLTSKETNNFIESHISQCNACQRELNTLADAIPVPSIDKDEVNYLKTFQHKLKSAILWGCLIALSVFLVGYIGIVLYRFCLLQSVCAKFENYKHVDTVFVEMNQTHFTNSNFTEDNNTKYWYKNGIAKYEIKSIKNNSHYIVILDYNNNIEYRLDANNKKAFIVYNADMEEGFEDGRILDSLLGLYYFSPSTSLKIASNILKNNVEREEDKIIMEANGLCSFDSKTGLINTIYTNDLIGNSSITTYQYQLDSISDEQLNIPNLDAYDVQEVK